MYSVPTPTPNIPSQSPSTSSLVGRASCWHKPRGVLLPASPLDSKQLPAPGQKHQSEAQRVSNPQHWCLGQSLLQLLKCSLAVFIPLHLVRTSLASQVGCNGGDKLSVVPHQANEGTHILLHHRPWVLQDLPWVWLYLSPNEVS